MCATDPAAILARKAVHGNDCHPQSLFGKGEASAGCRVRLLEQVDEQSLEQCF
jgi:hypothetical protein